MIYDMLDKAQRGEYQVENSVPLDARRFCTLNPASDIHDILDIGVRFYVHGR